jgi:Domain of unknown function (DUF4160)
VEARSPNTFSRQGVEAAKYLTMYAPSITQAVRNMGTISLVPTVMRFDGLRVAVYPNDHRPAHVHVIGRDCEAVFNLNCPAGPPDLRENYGFPTREVGTY